MRRKLKRLLISTYLSFRHWLWGLAPDRATPYITMTVIKWAILPLMASFFHKATRACLIIHKGKNFLGKSLDFFKLFLLSFVGCRCMYKKSLQIGSSLFLNICNYFFSHKLLNPVHFLVDQTQ